MTTVMERLRLPSEADLAPVSGADLQALWRGVTDGRWRIVDHYDARGRRHFVAIRADARPLPLSRRERDVCAVVARGAPNKVVASELGLSPSTVGSYLASAMRKLGIGSRSLLIAVWNVAPALGGPPALTARARADSPARSFPSCSGSASSSSD